MIYLPDEFLINKNNRDEVLDILKNLDSDIFFDDEDSEKIFLLAQKKLEKLGELTVLRKLNEGFFSFGA